MLNAVEETPPCLGAMAEELGRLTATLADMLERRDAEEAALHRATQQLLLKVAQAVCDLDEQEERLRGLTAEHGRQIEELRGEMRQGMRGAPPEDGGSGRIVVYGDVPHVAAGAEAAPRWWLQRTGEPEGLPYEAPALAELLTAMGPFVTAAAAEFSKLGACSLLASATLSFCIAVAP